MLGKTLGEEWRGNFMEIFLMLPSGGVCGRLCSLSIPDLWPLQIWEHHGAAAKGHRYLCKDPNTFAGCVPLLCSSQQCGFGLPICQGTLPPSEVLLSPAVSMNPLCLQPSSSPVFQLLHHFLLSSKATSAVLFLYVIVFWDMYKPLVFCFANII